MGYFRELHGSKKGNNDFIEGVIAGITCYAVWKDSRQVVGVMEERLSVAVEGVKEDLGYYKGVGEKKDARKQGAPLAELLGAVQAQLDENVKLSVLISVPKSLLREVVKEGRRVLCRVEKGEKKDA